MKTLLLAVIGLAVFILGYLIGSFFPLTNFSFLQGKSISGEAKLEVKLVMDNGTPVTNVEVDLGEKPGPPPKGGIAATNEEGVATFLVKPGNYVVYFNLGTFPKNLQMPQTKPVLVEAGEVNQTTLVLRTK